MACDVGSEPVPGWVTGVWILPSLTLDPTATLAWWGSGMRAWRGVDACAQIGAAGANWLSMLLGWGRIGAVAFRWAHQLAAPAHSGAVTIDARRRSL